MSFSTDYNEAKYSSWKELPTADVVYNWLKARASIMARIRALSLEIQLEEARITQQKPRDKAVRVTGLNGDDSVVRLRRQLAAAQSELDDVEADIKMFEFRRDVFKSLSFKERV